MAHVPVHDAVLRFQSLGYTKARLRLDLSSDSGYSAVVPLVPARVVICADRAPWITTPYPSMKIFVFDSRTGRAPQGVPVTVEVVDGDYREEHRAIVDGDTLRIETGPWRMGAYDVTVTAPSYAPSRIRDVIVGVNDCDSQLQTHLRVFLLPAGKVLGG